MPSLLALASRIICCVTTHSLFFSTEFEPRYGFQGLHSGLCCILSPPPPPPSTLDLPRVLSLLPWSGSAIITLLEHVGIISDHRDEQPLPVIDGRSLLGTASSRWAEPETATVPRGKGFSIRKCSTRNCRAGPCRAVASALCLIPHLGSARGTLMYSSSSRGLQVVSEALALAPPPRVLPLCPRCLCTSGEHALSVSFLQKS